jgi:hypothetical protein
VVAFAMQLLIWLVNSNIENSFSTGIIGLAFGPVWVAGMKMATEILHPDVHMVSMALM